MAKRINKYLYEINVQGKYSSGWEDVTGARNWSEARKHKREYRENEPGIPFRIIQRRVPNHEHPVHKEAA